MDFLKLNAEAPVSKDETDVVEYLKDNLGTFSEFSNARMEAFRNRQRGQAPCSHLQALNVSSFTNPYRMLDRVSQDLIKRIAHNPNFSQKEKIFHTYLFRVFNKTETYVKLLEQSSISPVELSQLITDSDADSCATLVQEYKNIVAVMKEVGLTVFSSAYKRNTSVPFVRYLDVLVDLVEDQSSQKLITAKSLYDLFIHWMPLNGFGPFLSYQLALDLNYCRSTPLPIDFVVPGPGCKRGMKYAFGDISTKQMVVYLKLITKHYPYIFGTGWSDFALNGKQYPLQENDVQNLFCEFSKYMNYSFFGDNPRRKISSNKPVPLTITIPNIKSR